MNTRSVVIGTIAVAAFAAGIVGGKAFRPASSVNVGPEVSEQTRFLPQSSTIDEPAPKPDNPLDELEAESNLLERSRLLIQITGAASALDCRRLMEQFRGDDLAVAQIAARWAELDPAGLFEFLKSSSRGGSFQTDEMLNVLFSAWARSDPHGAFAACRQTRSFTLRNRCVTELMGNLLYTDPSAAMEIASQVIADGEEVLGRFTRFADWADADRAGAAELILTLPRCKFRQRLATDLCRRWGTADLESAVQFAEQLDVQARNQAIDSSVAGLLQVDLDAARKFIESVGGTTRANLGHQLVRQMAVDDPVSAFDWIDDFLEGASRKRAIEAAVETGTRRHPDAVARFAENLPTGELKQSSIRTASRAWFEKDSDGAMEWLMQIEPGFALEAGIRGLRRANIPEDERTTLLEHILGSTFDAP